MARSKITPATRSSAIFMRSEGATYAEIATALSEEGISEDWCKRNLSKIPVYDIHYFLIEELIPLALRPEGIARLELRMRIKAAYDIADNAPIPEAIWKRTLRGLPEGSFVCPDYLDPEAAEESHQALCSGAIMLMDTFEECVADFLHRFPVASAWHVRDAMLKMLTGTHPGGPFVQGRQMNDAVEKLMDRVPQRGLPVEPIPGLDSEYERLCY